MWRSTDDECEYLTAARVPLSFSYRKICFFEGNLRAKMEATGDMEDVSVDLGSVYLV